MTLRGCFCGVARMSNARGPGERARAQIRGALAGLRAGGTGWSWPAGRGRGGGAAAQRRACDRSNVAAVDGRAQGGRADAGGRGAVGQGAWRRVRGAEGGGEGRAVRHRRVAERRACRVSATWPPPAPPFRCAPGAGGGAVEALRRGRLCGAGPRPPAGDSAALREADIRLRCTR